MKEKIKKLWTEALRGGKYKQGIQALKKADGSFCCLGVLCDLHRKSTKKAKNTWTGTKYLGEHDYLPEKVIKWAGLESNNGQFQVPSVFHEGMTTKTLAAENDRGASFENIAKIIDEKF